ncbi:hypothetical protein HOB91_01645 [Candidatus Woesearchaeota archaeon]|nr:hypothetical protein [Candidatus Woesearchaeota archaeon]MBT6402396.1 hypothetical protein [Candidatus Woesearchaeota archaeon]
MIWKKILLLTVGIILFSSPVFSQNDLISLELVDSSGNELNNIVALVDSDRVVLVNDGALKFESSVYGKIVEVILDDPNTEIMDYYFNGEIEESMEDIVLFPIAQVRGSVYDSLDNLLGNVDLEFDCNSLSSIDFPRKTDKYGGFSTYVPIGECTILSTNGKFMDKNVFETTQGDSIDIKLILNDKIDSGISFYWVIFILISLFTLYKFKPKKKKIVKKSPTKGKLKAILKTLSDSEKQIMEFIISNGNASTSSKIRHGLKIPKTSLSRTLNKLESKKILTMEREGKLKRVKISDWLLK